LLTHMEGSFAKELILPRLGKDIPLVAWGNDSGFTEDSLEGLNRRGENVTGAMYSYTDLVSRRFALMKELMPKIRRVSIAVRRTGSWTPAQLELDRLAGDAIASLVRPIGLEFVHVELPEAISLEDAIAEVRKARIDAVEARLEREAFDRFTSLGIAPCGIGPGAARNGALLSGWSVGYVETAVRLAAKVLRGQRASSIPVERVREYGLAINLSTARKLGVEFPPAIRIQANEVFE